MDSGLQAAGFTQQLRQRGEILLRMSEAFQEIGLRGKWQIHSVHPASSYPRHSDVKQHGIQEPGQDNEDSRRHYLASEC